MSALSEAVSALERAEEFRQAIGKHDESISYRIRLNKDGVEDYIVEAKYLRGHLIEALDKEIRDIKSNIDSILYPITEKS